MKKSSWATVLLILFSILVQFVFLAAIPEKERFKLPNDFKNIYHPLAVNLLEGNGYTDENGQFVTFSPPGYALMVAGLYDMADHFKIDRVHMIVYANMGWMTLCALLVFFLAWKAFSFSIGIYSALLWITYPFNLWLMKQPSTEAPFLFFFLLSLFFLYGIFRRPALILAAGAGVLVGISAMIRPVALFLPLAYGCVILFIKSISHGKRILLILILFLGFGLSVLPWEVKARLETGKWLPLCSNGPYSMLDGLRFVLRGNVDRNRLQLDQPMVEFMKRAEANKEEFKSAKDIISFLGAEWHKNPFTLMELGLLKLGRSWYGTDQMRLEKYILLCQLVYLISALLGLRLRMTELAKEPLYTASFGIFILYFWIMTFLVLSIVRYMIPAMVFVMICAAMLVDKYASFWQKRLRLRWLP